MVAVLRRDGHATRITHQVDGKPIKCETTVQPAVFDSLAGSLVSGEFFGFQERYAVRRLHQSTTAIVAYTIHDTARVSRYGMPSSAPRLLSQIEEVIDAVLINASC